MKAARIVKEIVCWFLALFLCVTFLRAGITKFDDGSGWSRAFRGWGFPVWFRMAIGAIETAAALLVLWPRTAAYGAAAMAIVMLGAIGTYLVNGQMHPTPVITLLTVSILLALRWRRRLTRGASPRSVIPAPPLFE